MNGVTSSPAPAPTQTPTDTDRSASADRLVAQGLQKPYGSRLVVPDVSRGGQRVEVVGPLGPAGAGTSHPSHSSWRPGARRGVGAA